jgi:hypothetical protein
MISRKQVSSSDSLAMTADLGPFGKTVAKLWARNPRHLLQQGMTANPQPKRFRRNW